MSADIGTTGAIVPSWVQKLVMSNGGEMTSTSVDSSGNVYICGNYFATSTFTFAGQTLPTSPYSNWPNGFFAKLDASGALQWIKVLKSNTLFVKCQKIKVDNDKLFIVGDYLTDTAMNLDTDPSVGVTVQLPVTSGGDGYMICASKDTGAAFWTARVGGGNNDVQMGIDTDATNVYFTGSYSAAITFNASVSLPSPYFAFDGCIIAIQKSTGDVVWAKGIPSGGYEIAYSVASYGTDIYVATNYIANTDITLQASPEIILPATTNGTASAPLLLKMKKSDGEISVVKYFQTTRDLSIAYTVATDATGVYLGGNYCSTSQISLGNSVFLPASESDIANYNTAFVIKYNHSGVAQWSRTVNTSTGYNNVTALIASEGYVYVCGQYLSTSGPSSFNSLVNLPQNSSTSAFIFCCNADGFPIWTDIMINSFNTATNDLAKTSDGIVVASRHAGYGLTIGNGVIPPNTGGLACPMVTKYLVQNPVIGPSNVNTVLAAAIAAAGNPTALGEIQAVTSAVAAKNQVQKIAAVSGAFVIGPAASVPKIATVTPIVTSTDNVVAVNAFSATSASVDKVTIAVARTTDQTTIATKVASPTPIPEMTQISISKFDSAGNPVSSILGDVTTYDEVIVTIALGETGKFGVIHTSASGVQTLVEANLDLKNASLNTEIPFANLAGGKAVVLAKDETKATVKIFTAFTGTSLPSNDGTGNFVQQNNQVVFQVTPLPCFVASTPILTPNGYKAIETIRSGDQVMTADGRAVQVNVYSRKVKYACATTAPFHIPAGTFGKSQPGALTVSPLHAVQIRKGVWEIPADAVHRYPQIKQVGLGEPVTYYHIETPNYFRDNLVANGNVVESFGGNQKHRVPAGKYIYTFSEASGGYVRYEPVAASMKSMRR